jgi:ATP-dependent Clp protease protease subunit
LLQNRIIYLGTEINEVTASSVILQLLWLNAEDPEKDIYIYINSPGGSVTDGFAIYDCINAITNKVHTLCIGQASSMGAFLLSSGTGSRMATKFSRIMVHSVYSGTQGTVHEQKISIEESEKLQKKLLEIIVKNSQGKLSLPILKRKTLLDWFMDPETALKFGLIDEIVEKI